MLSNAILDAIRRKLRQVGHDNGVFFPGRLMTRECMQIQTIRGALKRAGYANPAEEGGGTGPWVLTKEGMAWLGKKTKAVPKK